MKNIIRVCLIFILVGFYSINSCWAKDFSYMGSQDEKFQDLFYKALELEQKEKYQEAIKLLEEALKINPEQMQALGELCICCLEIKDSNKLKETALKGLQVAQDLYSKDNIGRFYHNLAGHYHMNEQYESAIKYFKLALHNKPYYTADYAPLGYCYYKLKKYDKAIECYKAIKNEEMVKEVRKAQLSEFPIEKNKYMAVKYMLEDNDKMLEAECKKILELDSDNVLGLIGLARVEAKDNNNEEAILLAEKALSLLDKKENEEYSFYYPYLYANVLNNCYNKLENFDKSTNYFKLYLIATCTADAGEAIEKGKTDLALSYYKKVLDSDNEIETKFVPYNYMAIDGIINLLFNIKKTEEAKKYIQKAIKICKSENNTNKLPYYTFQVGRYYAYLKQYDKAIKYYNKAFEDTNNLDDKYNYKYTAGNCYICLKDLKNALEQFNTCKELVEKGAEDIKDINSIIIFYKNSFDKNSNIGKSDEYIKLCREAFGKKDFEKAINYAEKALKYRPQYIESIMLLEETLFQLGREEEGLATAMDGINISKRDHDTSFIDILYYDVGNYYTRKEEYEKAAKLYTLAASFNPTDKDYFYNIGYCYKHLKKYQKAINAFEIGLKLDPNDKGMADHLKDCKMMLKK